MRKILSVIVIFVLFAGLTAAQPSDSAQNDQSPEVDQGAQDSAPDSPSQSQSPDSAPDSPQGKKPSLPSQASQTAKNVVGTVFGAMSNGAKSIGDALSSLLGGGNSEE